MNRFAPQAKALVIAPADPDHGESDPLRGDPCREMMLTPHIDAVHRFCNSRLHSVADAEDAAQDTFIRFLVSEDTIRNPEAWLIHAAHYVCASYRRRETRHATQRSGLIARSEAVPDPADIAVERRTTAQLLSRLRDMDRVLLQKLYVQGLNARQVGAELRVSPGNVRVMALRARRRARDVLADSYSGSHLSYCRRTAPVTERGLAATTRRQIRMRRDVDDCRGNPD